MKRAPILSAIKHAQKSIDPTLYHLDDEAVIDNLIEAKKRGVNVPEVFSVFNNDWESSLSYDEARGPKKE